MINKQTSMPTQDAAADANIKQEKESSSKSKSKNQINLSRKFGAE